MAVAIQASHVCSTLEAILRRTFGPNGTDVLLSSSSGDILITNNGALILRSLNLENYIGQSIVDKVVSHCSITGDGSTSFIFLLTALLREVVTHTGVKITIREDEFSPSQRQSFLALSRGFFKLESLLREVVGPVLEKVAIKMNLEDSDISVIKLRIKRLINSSLNGKFPSNMVTQFAELLSDLVTKFCNFSTTSLKDSLLQMIDDFSQICVEVPGVPVSSSQIQPGILIPREFATELEKIPSQAFKFVVLNCSFDILGPLTSSAVQIRDQVSLASSLQWKGNHIQKLISKFRQIDVRLVLSSENVSDMALHFCKQRSIAVVSMIPEECTQYICKCSGMIPIANLDFNSLSEHFFGTGIFCGVQKVGQNRFVHLQVKPANRDFIPHSLILSSPVQGICKQYSIALHNALKCVKMSLSKDGRNLSLLPGAGAAEFALSVNLKDIAASIEDSSLSTALQTLSDALRIIPASLHQNSFSMQNQKEHFVYCFKELERSLRNDNVLLGINCKTGKPVDSCKLEIYEPLLGKYLLLQNVLQCLSQLLRIDKFVSAKAVT